MSTLTIVSSVEGWTMPDDAGDTVSLKCCASSFASLSSVGSVLEKDQQIVAALVNIIPSSENARSPRDPPHMTAEGSRFRVHPNSHLQVLSPTQNSIQSVISLEHSNELTHVVICGTGTTSGSNVWNPSTFLASPAKHVSRVCSFLDKALDGDGVILVHSPQGHNRAMLILVSGACDGSDVAEPADSDEAIESFTLHKTSFNQAVRLTQSAPSVRTAPKVKLPSSLAPRVNRQAGRSLRDRFCKCAGTILGAPDDSGIDGSWKPKLSALRTIEQNALRRQRIGRAPLEIVGRTTSQSCDEFGPKYAIAEHTRQIRLDHSRTACPAAHTHTTLPAALLAPPHTLRRQRTTTQTALALVAHTHKPLSPPKDHANLNEPPSPVLVTMLRFSRGNGMRSPQHSKPAPKLVSLPTTLHTLLPKIRQCAFCECEEENTDNTSREGKAVAAMKKHHF
ncbi:hypothetical protein BLNAU_22443 [Blattamonas nauphoetae]|uniref:Uncharacterized protein n=1 Tax=Blattamonas nauphoetae TaxID=2049346 RepID=A0ABQ9WT23_9EUKA|nr:hypothetical protein BLNAU_22443 [Blattamonas nauphoetae]